MIVVDASVLANVVGDGDSDGELAREAIRGQELSVPDIAHVQVVSVLRRRWLAKTITAHRFDAAIDDLAALPVEHYPALPFLRRAYELRSNVSAYDAMYVALAGQLDCPLITADRRLASAAGTRCTITVIRT